MNITLMATFTIALLPSAFGHLLNNDGLRRMIFQ
jgi:hypothetical protein